MYAYDVCIHIWYLNYDGHDAFEALLFQEKMPKNEAQNQI